ALQLQYIYLVDDLVGVVERFGDVVKELAHFGLGFKEELVVREAEAIALATFFISCDGRALHIAGIYAKQNIMRVTVLLIHVVRIVGADHFYVKLFGVLSQLIINDLLLGDIVALQLDVIVFAEKVR